MEIERKSDLAEEELPHVRLEDLAQRAPLVLRLPRYDCTIQVSSLSRF